MIYISHKAEGIALLAYTNDIWDIVVPEQTVSGAYVKYDSSKFKGIVGSIHSHCMMNAFFSGIDDNDQASFDGIHIVLGKVMFDVPEIVTSVYVNGYQQKFKPDTLIDDLPVFKMPSHKWLDKVKVNKEHDIKYDDEMLEELLERQEFDKLNEDEQLEILDKMEFEEWEKSQL